MVDAMTQSMIKLLFGDHKWAPTFWLWGRLFQFPAVIDVIQTIWTFYSDLQIVEQEWFWFDFFLS